MRNNSHHLLPFASELCPPASVNPASLRRDHFITQRSVPAAPARILPLHLVFVRVRGGTRGRARAVPQGPSLPMEWRRYTAVRHGPSGTQLSLSQPANRSRRPAWQSICRVPESQTFPFLASKGRRQRRRPEPQNSQHGARPSPPPAQLGPPSSASAGRQLPNGSPNVSRLPSSQAADAE